MVGLTSLTEVSAAPLDVFAPPPTTVVAVRPGPTFWIVLPFHIVTKKKEFVGSISTP